MRKDSILKLLKLAKEFAHSVHESEIRKYSGEPYIEHPKRVAENVSAIEEKILAWLHDTVENSDHAIWSVKERCHLTDDLTFSLYALTRQKNES